MKRVGSYNQYGGNTSYYRNRTYGRRINKKRMTIFIIIIAVGLIVLFACVGNAVAENKKNEKIQQLTEYGLDMFEQQVLYGQMIDEMRDVGFADLTLQINGADYKTDFDSSNDVLTLTCEASDYNYSSNDIDQFASVKKDSDEAIQLYNIMVSMAKIKDKYFYDNDDGMIERSYKVDGVGTVVIQIEDLLEQCLTVKNENNSIILFQKNHYNSVDEFSYGYENASLTLNGNDLYKKNDSFTNGSLGGDSSNGSSSSSTKTNKCAQCGKPIHADETWCDDCLFGSVGGDGQYYTPDDESYYDSNYQSNLEKIADAYGVSPNEVDDMIKSYTGE